MTLPGGTLDASFVLAVTGAALVWPPLALIVGAGYLALSAFLARSVPPEAK